uniref:Uncharacterized protein n=1 Tax=Glossina palpalis gambiensis TaxID=67801 RepID=A0A1B0B0D1_9MUSC
MKTKTERTAVLHLHASTKPFNQHCNKINNSNINNNNNKQHYNIKSVAQDYSAIDVLDKLGLVVAEGRLLLLSCFLDSPFSPFPPFAVLSVQRNHII